MKSQQPVSWSEDKYFRYDNGRRTCANIVSTRGAVAETRMIGFSAITMPAKWRVLPRARCIRSALHGDIPY